MSDYQTTVAITAFPTTRWPKSSGSRRRPPSKNRCSLRRSTFAPAASPRLRVCLGLSTAPALAPVQHGLGVASRRPDSIAAMVGCAMPERAAMARWVSWRCARAWRRSVDDRFMSIAHPLSGAVGSVPTSGPLLSLTLARKDRDRTALGVPGSGHNRLFANEGVGAIAGWGGRGLP